MTSIATDRILASAQRGLRNDIRREFQIVGTQLRALMTRSANADGIIPRSRGPEVVRQAGVLVERMFVGANGKPFADDGVTAAAPYPRVLNKWYTVTVAMVATKHHEWMRRRVPKDVFATLAGARSKPMAVVTEADNPYIRRNGESIADHIARLGDLRIFSPNKLAEYDPMHLWVDPNGYRLSDRIWNTADDTRTAINKLIRDGIQQGWSAEKLAKTLEQFLDPSRAALRTKKPYGRDGSFDAMRLARTEIARAHAQASYMAALTNPYVEGIDWALSPSHPRTDICDSYATIGMGGGRIKEPYTLGAPKLPPAHPHCLCRVQPYVSATPKEITDKLRAIFQDPDFALYPLPVITPAQLDQFLLLLLGFGLYQLFKEETAA
ncbi:MAG: hypothetical protein JNJ61_25815 [Anaerolineae bacterium]|nr:hypothetical protein [Anaerolineae bacterium]